MVHFVETELEGCVEAEIFAQRGDVSIGSERFFVIFENDQGDGKVFRQALL